MVDTRHTYYLMPKLSPHDFKANSMALPFSCNLLSHIIWNRIKRNSRPVVDAHIESINNQNERHEENENKRMKN